MPIPGLKPRYETRAKVRIGEKRESQNGRSYPAAVDYFVCDDAEFHSLCGAKPKTISIRLVHDDVDDVFKTGMEWWMGKLQACASDGDGTALRKASVSPRDGQQGATGINLLANVKVLDPRPIGNDRRKIECRFRDCPDFGANAGNKKCRVMGRLFFELEGQGVGGVYQLDTKSWNTIEELTGALTAARARGPLTGRTFHLSVEFRRKGADRFPVISIQEADVPINDEQGWKGLEARVRIENGLAASEEPRTILAAALDIERPGWRDDQRFIDRIKEVGPAVALTNYKKTLDEKLA